MRSKSISKALTLTAIIILTGLIIPSSAFAESKSVVINISATVAPLFELNVSGPAGGNIQFGNIQKDADGSVSVDSGEVVLTARTNKREPYQITQMLITPLKNEEGEAFGEDAITSYAQSEKPGMAVAEGATVSTSPTTLFKSDPLGLSNVIRANYKLRVSPEQAAGDYSSKLIYTITTI